MVRNMCDDLAEQEIVTLSKLGFILARSGGSLALAAFAGVPETAGRGALAGRARRTVSIILCLCLAFICVPGAVAKKKENVGGGSLYSTSGKRMSKYGYKDNSRFSKTAASFEHYRLPNKAHPKEVFSSQSMQHDVLLGRAPNTVQSSSMQSKSKFPFFHGKEKFPQSQVKNMPNVQDTTSQLMMSGESQKHLMSLSFLHHEKSKSVNDAESVPSALKNIGAAPKKSLTAFFHHDKSPTEDEARNVPPAQKIAKTPKKEKLKQPKKPGRSQLDMDDEPQVAAQSENTTSYVNRGEMQAPGQNMKIATSKPLHHEWSDGDEDESAKPVQPKIKTIQAMETVTQSSGHGWSD